MYRAKDLGRSRAMFYDVNMGGQRPVPTDSGLHLALRRREFSLFYQPQYSIADGSLTGLEALLPADAVILAVAHESYLDSGWPLIQKLLTGGEGLVLDIKMKLDRRAKPAGIELWRP